VKQKLESFLDIGNDRGPPKEKKIQHPGRSAFPSLAIVYFCGAVAGVNAKPEGVTQGLVVGLG
jgi:hypothetical protein